MAGFAPAAGSDTFRPFLFPETITPSNRFARSGFVLFLLATAALICRPADLFPRIQSIPIYEPIMMACLAISIPRLLHQVLSTNLAARPITLLILGICPAIVMSHLARGSLHDARVDGSEFFKISLYYLLLLSWIDSPARLRRFLLWLCACAMVLVVAAMLQYSGKINLPALACVREGYTDPSTGVSSELFRLCGVGIFHDPNDLCLVLVVAIAISLYFLGDRRIKWFRFGWIFPLTLFGLAMMQTYSRSGLMALLAGISTVLIARLGWQRATLIGLILVPAMLLVCAGRQTNVDLSNPDDTFQTRLDLWNNALTLFEQSPVFGCGAGQQVELSGHVAHNSFVEGFAEIGFFGGTFFLGAVLISIGGICRSWRFAGDPELSRLRPYLLGAVAGYAISLFSLTRTYSVPTYLVLGLAAAYINLTPRPAEMILRINGQLFRRLATASVLFLFTTYLFLRVMSI